MTSLHEVQSNGETVCQGPSFAPLAAYQDAQTKVAVLANLTGIGLLDRWELATFTEHVEAALAMLDFGGSR